MGALINPAEAKWTRLLELGSWVLWYRETNRYGWSYFNLRNYAQDAAKRSYDVRWDGQRLARTQDVERLTMSEPRLLQQLQVRLRRWKPPQ